MLDSSQGTKSWHQRQIGFRILSTIYLVQFNEDKDQFRLGRSRLQTDDLTTKSLDPCTTQQCELGDTREVCDAVDKLVKKCMTCVKDIFAKKE